MMECEIGGQRIQQRVPVRAFVHAEWFELPLGSGLEHASLGIERDGERFLVEGNPACEALARGEADERRAVGGRAQGQHAIDRAASARLRDTVVFAVREETFVGRLCQGAAGLAEHRETLAIDGSGFSQAVAEFR